jgi:asparagine synthase (glutamine-hydrolysing)
VHLYAIAVNAASLSEERLSTELGVVGDSFALDPATAWSARSDGGAVVAAGLHHSRERCGPRRYLARDAAHVTWFDGLPVERSDRFRGCDAEALAANWPMLETCLEGQFNAVRVDFQSERAEVLLDTLGLVQVFVARDGDGWVISNSATVLASALELRTPDQLGVSSFLGLGWASGDRTLTSGVRVLCGGARHSFSGDGHATRRHFGPETIPERGGEHFAASDVAESLTSLTASAVRDMDRVGCALTAGRDTRMLAALLRATGEDALYFTGGTAEHPDVVIACEIAQGLGLRHEVVCHDPNGASRDWTDAAVQFVRQNDGLVSLKQLGDYIDLSVERPPLGVKLGGVGGEIGRCGTGQLTAIATNVPFLRASVRAQRKLLAMKARNDGGLMTPESCQELARYLDAFREQRLGEGWRPHELQEAFYTFERVGRWGASGRRMAGTDDAFLPLCSRAFIDYCFSLAATERYIEAPHYRLLTELSPALRDHRFESPLLPQRSWVAPLHASCKLTHAIRQRVQTSRSGASGEDQVPAAVQPAYPFPHAWLEKRLELVRSLFSEPSAELWSFISKPRIEALLNGPEADRARYQEALLRATTVFWHFHGPPA